MNESLRLDDPLNLVIVSHGGAPLAALVIAHVLVAMSVMWAIRPWPQRFLAVGMAAFLGRMPAPVGILATVAIGAHRAWFSPRFMVVNILVGTICVVVMNVWALRGHDYASSLLFAAAVVDFRDRLPPMHRHWRVVAIALIAGAIGTVMQLGGSAVFALLYWLTRGGGRTTLSLTLAMGIIGGLIYKYAENGELPVATYAGATAMLLAVAFYAAQPSLDGLVAQFESNDRS